MTQLRKVGYARVSTDDQDLQRQILALEEWGATEIYQDKVSGTKNYEAEEYRRLMADTHKEPLHIGVSELSRFGRSFTQLLANLEDLDARGSHFTCLNNSSIKVGGNSQDKLMLRILAAVSEFERDLISERTKDGLKAARIKLAKEGKTLGRPSKLSPDQIETAQQLEASGWGVQRIADSLGVSKTTALRALGRLGNGAGSKAGKR